MTRLVRAELLKLTSTWVLLWLSLLMFGLETLFVSLNAAQNSTEYVARPGTQRDLVSAAAISALIAAIVGILVSAGEYAHGTIGQTFLVSPRRVRVLAAKLVAATFAGVGLAVVADAAAYGLAALWISGKSAPSHLGSHDVRFLLLGTLVAAAIAAAIGVGLGALLRHQTAAIVLTLVWLLVGEPLLAIAGVQRYAPGHVTVAVIDAGRHSGQLLHFWPGVLLGLCYATFFAVTGAVAVARTDVT